MSKDKKDAKDAKAAAPAVSKDVTNTGSHAPSAIGGVLEPTISAILILDNEGNRLAAKYYTKDVSLSDLKSQMAFEKKVFEKTGKLNARADADILMFDNLLGVFKFRADVHMYVFVPVEENELLALTAMNALDEVLLDVLRKGANGGDGSNSPGGGGGGGVGGGVAMSKRALLENLDLVMVAIDEIVDDGTVLETDSFEVVNRVSMASAVKEIPLSEQTFNQVLNTAKNQLIQSFS